MVRSLVFNVIPCNVMLASKSVNLWDLQSEITNAMDDYPFMYLFVEDVTRYKGDKHRLRKLPKPRKGEYDLNKILNSTPGPGRKVHRLYVLGDQKVFEGYIEWARDNEIEITFKW